MTKESRRSLRSTAQNLWRLFRDRKGLLLASLLLIAVNRLSGLAIPVSTKFLVDNVISGKHPDQLTLVVVGVLLATGVQATTSYTLTQLLSRTAQRIMRDARNELHAHILRLPVRFFDENATGALVSRVMSDVEGLRNLLGNGLVDFVGGLFAAVVSFGLLLRISWTMTAAVFVVIVGFCLFLGRGLGRLRPNFREQAKVRAEVSARLTESVGGIRVVKGYSAEDRESETFAQGSEELFQAAIRTLTTTSLLNLASTTVLGLVAATVIFLGVRSILSHQITLGAYFMYTMLLAFMVGPILQVVSVGTQLTEAIAGLDRNEELLSEVREGSETERIVDLTRVGGAVRFNSIEFCYLRGTSVLRNISLDADCGSLTALVGSSGAGKSTLVNLLCGFYKPDGGQILVDGVDLSTIRLGSYRQQIGMVPQDGFLFEGSLKRNVMFARPDASQDEFYRACEIARVDELAESLSDGYKTVVGERGVKLSGGQRQRVAIARAILADPRILILDEATSALDSESEELIQESLAVLMRGRTTFVIAHRLSTIKKADQILVLDRGEIVERGTHASLYANRGRYHSLYMRQEFRE
jgi:ABC-type multidrug transport system fused ATPase/permease subunit